MQQTLEEREISVQFFDRSADEIHLAYKTHEIDVTRLFSQLKAVIVTILEEGEPGPVEGAMFHTDRPIIGLWRIESEWFQRYRDGELSKTAVVSKALHTLDVAQFQ